MVNSPIQLFNHDKFGEIRIVDNDGQQWFVAKDVATALGYSDPKKAVNQHCRKGEAISPPSSSDSGHGGLRHIKIIPESDVFRLVMRSKLPDAETFQDWVVEEVLPSIRKTGSYQAPETYEELSARALRLADQRVAEQKAKIEEDAPKVEFYDRVTGSETICQLGVACQVADLPLGRNKLFATLRDQGVLLRTGERRNHPRQEYVDRGYFTVVASEYTDKETEKTYITYVTHCTQRGIDWLIKRFSPEQESAPTQSSAAPSVAI